MHLTQCVHRACQHQKFGSHFFVIGFAFITPANLEQRRKLRAHYTTDGNPKRSAAARVLLKRVIELTQLYIVLGLENIDDAALDFVDFTVSKSTVRFLILK